MFGLGATELVVIIVLAILVLGPQRLPMAAAQLGKTIRNLRKASHDLQDQIDQDGNLSRSVADLRSALHGDPSRPLPSSLPKPVSETVSTHEEPAKPATESAERSPL